MGERRILDMSMIQCETSMVNDTFEATYVVVKGSLELRHWLITTMHQVYDIERHVSQIKKKDLKFTLGYYC